MITNTFFLAAIFGAALSLDDYKAACDALAWKELPLGQRIVLPDVPDVPNKTELQLYLAERLVQGAFYEEAAAILDNVPDNSAFLPVVLRAVTAYHLGQPDKLTAALKSFDELPAGQSVPRRYVEIMKMLKQETQQKKQDKDKISQRMSSVRRQLGKGKTDKDTQKDENDILKELDQYIEKIEKQLNPNGGQPQGGQSNKPAKDSFRMKLQAPGDVNRRDFSPDSDWGSLPPKERDEALLKIEKDFPPFYRDIIEEYFKAMAK